MKEYREREEHYSNHYTGKITIETICKETGKETYTVLEGVYNSGKIEPDKRTLVTKMVRKALSEFKEVKR